MNKRNKEWRAEKKQDLTATQWAFQKLNDNSNSALKLSIVNGKKMICKHTKGGKVPLNACIKNLDKVS